jgi:hypothetical protein
MQWSLKFAEDQKASIVTLLPEQYKKLLNRIKQKLKKSSQHTINLVLIIHKSNLNLENDLFIRRTLSSIMRVRNSMPTREKHHSMDQRNVSKMTRSLVKITMITSLSIRTLIIKRAMKLLQGNLHIMKKNLREKVLEFT